MEYALLLQKRSTAGWRTVLVADNSHEGKQYSDIDEHHYHRYVGGEKQPAEPLPFPVVDTNDAMAKVMQWFKSEWEELIS